MKIALALGFALATTSLGGFVAQLARDHGLTAQIATSSLAGAAAPALQREWRLVSGKHWQIVAAPIESPAATDAIEGTRGACAPGMVEVRGRMKLDPPPSTKQTIEELQKLTCRKWINREYPERCAEFDRDKWLKLSRELTTKPMSYCIDRYEYPNRKGAYPMVMMTWYEAVDACAAEGKRLCDEAEWTFACEGEEAMPYPYGYVRDPDACVVDQKWRPFNEAALIPRENEAAMVELDRLWQGVASGSRPKCRSPFGVYDLTGNVDEWTRTVKDGERPSILKGGYWGPVRTRCRPSTRSHDENHAFYQQGVRCCADPGRPVVPRTSSPDPASAPLPRELR